MQPLNNWFSEYVSAEYFEECINLDVGRIAPRDSKGVYSVCLGEG